MSEETKDEQELKTRRFMTAAMIFGFNEQARLAKTLGEKVAYRQARDAATEEFRRLGGDVSDLKVDPVILTLPDHTPQVHFHEKDIELMRATVAEHDASKKVPQKVSGKIPTTQEVEAALAEEERDAVFSSTTSDFYLGNAAGAARVYRSVVLPISQERDVLRSELERVSREMGLPPGLGPAEGELYRILQEGRQAIEQNKKLLGQLARIRAAIEADREGNSNYLLLRGDVERALEEDA